jgi:general stress protein 26
MNDRGAGSTTNAELLRTLVEVFERAMLVTRCGDDLRSRPMTLAHTRDTKRLWLLSGALGDSLEDLRVDPHVNVVMQDALRFCSISGIARIARPDTRAQWSDTERAWMLGARRSSLVLIEVTPQYAEYWDRSDANGLRFSAPAPAEGARPNTHATNQLLAAGASRAAPDAPSNVIRLEHRRWKR